MKFKKLLSIALASAMVLGVAGCSSSGDTASSSGGATESGDKAVKIKLAGIYAAETGESQAMYKFKELIEAKSDSITVEVYPNCQLGNEETLTDGVRQGNVEMAVTGSTWAQYMPYMAIGEYAFLFDGWDSAKTALTNEEIVADITQGGTEAGVQVLGMNPAGFRVVTSNKPIEKMDDYKGFRLRVPNIPQYLTMTELLGATPVAMSLSELFTGLEQKVVDGQENPFSTIIANKFYEVQPYAINTKHMLTAHIWTMNTRFWEGLSEQQQADILECTKGAIEFCWDYYETSEADEISYLEGEGVTVLQPSDEFVAEMKDALEVPYAEWFEEEYPGSTEIVDKIKALE